MKKLTFNRRQILRCIRAACIALFLAGCFGYASAAPVAGPGFTINGTQVIGSGQHAATYFYDATTTGYNVNIQSGANLNNTGSSYSNLIQFDHGTVTNSGSLIGTGDAIYLGANNTTGPGGSFGFSVTNSGYISGTSSAIYAYPHYTGGTSTSSTTSVNNSGTLIGGSSSGSYGVGVFPYNTGTSGNLVNTIAVNNSSTGKITAYYGLCLGIQNKTVDGNSDSSISVSNAGLITSSYTGVYGYNYDQNSLYLTGATSDKQSLTLDNTGMIDASAGTYGIYFYNYSYGQYYADTTQTIGVTNSNSIVGGSYGLYLENYSDSYVGYYTPGANVNLAIMASNSGTLKGVSSYGMYGYNYSEYSGYYGSDVPGNNNNTISVTNTNSGSIQGNIYGVYLENYDYEAYNFGQNNNAITLTNNGFIGGVNGASASSYGAYLENYNEYNYYGSSDSNSIAVTNTGKILGDTGLYAYNYDYYAGYYHGAPVTNTLTLNNSGYIGGTGGEGAYLENYIDYTNGSTSATSLSTNTITVTNSGQIVGQSNSGLYTYNYAGSINGDATNTTKITNSGILLSNSGDGLQVYSYAGASGVANSTVSISNTGLIQGTGSGIYVTNSASGATSVQSTSVVNTGQIMGGTYGVYFNDNNSSLKTSGGIISGGTDAVYLNGSASSVTIQGRSNIQGTIEGNGNTGNTLNLNLIMSPTKAAQLKAAIAAAGTGPGTFTDPSGYVYSWDGFSAVNANVLSLQNSVDSGLVAAATAIDNGGLPANTGPGSAGAKFDEFYGAAYSNPEAAMNKLVGRQINQGIDSLSVNLNTSLASNIQSHLDNLLTGNQVGGLDLGGINVNQGGDMLAFSETSTHLNALSSMVDTLSLRGTEMSTDSKNMIGSVSETPKWGVWASGNVTLGTETSNNGLPGYHSTMGTPTIGADYRVCPNLTLGILGSYTTGGAGFTDGSRINTNVEMAAVYGTWRTGNWHVNGLAGAGHTNFDTSRATFGGLANSNPDGYEVLTDWMGGYDFHLGPKLVITPEIGLQYTHLGVDGYTETGAGVFDLAVGSQDINSLRSHIGFKMDRAFTVGRNLTFIPELRAQWYHEFMDDSRGVSTSLPGAPAVGSFAVGTYAPQRDFALVGAGLNTAFTGYKGVPVQMFVNYDLQVGQSDYIANSVNAGVRVNF